MSYNALITPFLCMIFLASCIFQTPIFAAESVDAIIFRIRFKVHILNGFANNVTPLVIKCHSNDDDLGQHTLWQNQEFRFEFKAGVMKTTRFVCNFNWGSKSLADISVFRDTVEADTCKSSGNCFWKAKEDGIYFSSNYQNWEKKFNW